MGVVDLGRTGLVGRRVREVQGDGLDETYGRLDSYDTVAADTVAGTTAVVGVQRMEQCHQ